MLNIFNDFINLIFSKNNGSIGDLEKIFSGETVNIATQQAQGQQITPETPDEAPQGPIWLRAPEKTKSTIVPCIVIDKRDRWHDRVKVDLGDIDATDFTWQYYGFSYPVLVEKEDGTLEPFTLPETAGENCTVLYKDATSPGYKAISQRKNSFLQKLQTGLMVAVVITLFVLMFVLLDWK